MMKTRWLLCLIFPVASLPAGDGTLNLPIGDPARKHREVELVLDAVTDCETGNLLTPAELAAKIRDARLVIVGESHTGMDFHVVQKRVLEELFRSGKRILIGLEMYPYTEQQHLDNWSAGFLTEEGFIDLSRWYKNWGYHWNYYREIFLFARDHGIPLVAVNTPREVVSSVRKKGFANLTAEEAAHIPEKIDMASEEHYRLFKSFFEEEESGIHTSLKEEQWRSMFEAQCTWDATMAFNAVRALEDDREKESIMVLLAGSGHVAYGLGIQRQAALHFTGKAVSIIPVRVRDQKDRPVKMVQASYADFLWGLPPEKDPVYPELGISTVEAEGGTRRKVVSVEKDSPAKRAGFQVGDILLSMDGIDPVDRENLNRMLARKRWGDSARFVVLRGEELISMEVFLRRRAGTP